MENQTPEHKGIEQGNLEIRRSLKILYTKTACVRPLGCRLHWGPHTDYIRDHTPYTDKLDVLVRKLEHPTAPTIITEVVVICGHDKFL